MPFGVGHQAPIVGTLDQDRTDILRLLHDRYIAVDTIVEDYERLRLQDFGIALGTSRRGRLRGRMRSIYNQRATGTISMHTLRHLLKETEHMWACSECSDVDSANQ